MSSNRSPKVSVVMAAYNAADYIETAVDSILAQTFTDFEFIIIDDGSSDGTCILIKGYDDPRIRVIKNERNLGLTLSLNKGLMAAQGRYIARQDADDISYATRLAKQVAFLDEHAEVGLVGSSWDTIDVQGKKLSTKHTITDSQQLAEQILVENAITHGTVLIRRGIIEQAGLYRPEVGNAEDLDLWLRMGEVSRLANLEEPLYASRVHDKSIVGGSLEFHLESVYKVRQLTLERWVQAGNTLATKTTLARCYLLMACQDFASDRPTQGRAHLLSAQMQDANLPVKHDCETDIAFYALWACKIADPTGDVGHWSRLGKDYVWRVVAEIPQGWSFSWRRIYAHFLVIAAYNAYRREQFGKALRYSCSGVRNDLHWAKNRGLWRVFSGSLFRHRIVF